MALKRLKKEFADLIEEPSYLFTAEPLEDENLFEWVGTIYGPKESPYEGGVFYLDILFPRDYPFKPPKVKFLTPIYHTNINKHGKMCLDALYREWSPCLTISKILLLIHSMLTDPDYDCPLNTEAANLYKTDRQMYNKLAKEWTEKHSIS